MLYRKHFVMLIALLGALMKLADKFSFVKPSATLAINAKTLELKAQGKEIISLAVGEPDFDTPKHICDAAKAAIDARFTRYTAVPGIMDLRKAVANYYNNEYDGEVLAEHVVISNGGKQPLYNIMQALLNPADEVLVPTPYWVSYPDMVALAGAVSVEVKSGVENEFKITPQLLEQHIGPKSRMLIMNSPSNPTGAIYSQDEFDAIMELAISKGLFVISDEIYDQLVYDGNKSATAVHWFNKYPEQVAICNGLSKSYAMTGWRVGYSIACASLTKAIVNLQGQSTSNVCSIAQKAALAALEGPTQFMQEMRTAFIRRRDMGESMIQGWSKAICPKPGGAFYFFIDVHKYFGSEVKNDVELCNLLLEKAQVALVPGSAFGDDKCIRISYALADSVLEDALGRIGQILEKIN